MNWVKARRTARITAVAIGLALSLGCAGLASEYGCHASARLTPARTEACRGKGWYGDAGGFGHAYFRYNAEKNALASCGDTVAADLRDPHGCLLGVEEPCKITKCEVYSSLIVPWH